MSKAVDKMELLIELGLLIIGESVVGAEGSAFEFDSVFAATSGVASSDSATVVAWLFALLSGATAEW